MTAQQSSTPCLGQTRLSKFPSSTDQGAGGASEHGPFSLLFCWSTEQQRMLLEQTQPCTDNDARALVLDFMAQSRGETSFYLFKPPSL